MFRVTKLNILIGNIVYLFSIFCLFGGGFIDNYGYAFLGLYILYIFATFPKESTFAFFNLMTVPLYLFLLYYFFTNGFNIKNVLSIFGKVSPALIAFLHYRLMNGSADFLKMHKTIILISLVIIIGFSINALVLLQINPMLMRELVSTEVDESIIVGGGFGLPYSLAILIPVLLPVIWLKIHAKEYYNWEIYLIILFTIVGSLLIFRAQYMTSILLFLLGIYNVLLLKFKLKERIVFLFGGILLGSFFYVYLPMLFTLIGINEDSILFDRFEEIASLMSGDSHEAHDFAIRMGHILNTIKVFSKNILFGVGHTCNYGYEQLETIGVGLHAEWFDLLAIYGCFSSFMYMFLYRVCMLNMNKMNMAIYSFILLGFLNPLLQYQIFFVTFYMAPMIYLYYTKNRL